MTPPGEPGPAPPDAAADRRAGGGAERVRTFKLVIAYDGTDFHGWQSQPGQRTVQGVLEEAVRRLLGDGDLRTRGAARTDSGVHARGQVASFRARTRLPARALAPLLNPALPPDLRVVGAEEVPSDFDARRSALARRYSYRLLRTDDLLLGRIAWYPGRSFDVDRLVRATRPLEAAADFSAFRASGSGPANPVCRVMRASWRSEPSVARLDVIADHFLYHMVRNIVGAALAVAGSADPAACMRAILESRDRRRAGTTAPARGLCLEQVFFPRMAAP